jgi:hypothetical protein
VLDFEEIDQTQVAIVGGKGAHLGELSRIEGEPVISTVTCVRSMTRLHRFFAAAFCLAARRWRIRFARSSSARRRALRFSPPRLMKY